MNILSSLKSSYRKWQAEADKRSRQAIEKAQTENERDKIRARLRIEKAERKEQVAKAITKQKKAEEEAQRAVNNLRKSKPSNFSWLESLSLLGDKPKKKTVRKSKSKR